MRLDRLTPNFGPVEIEAEDSDVAEVTIDPLTVGDRRLGSIAALQVNRRLRLLLVNQPLPADFSRFQIKTKNLPLMHGVGRLRSITTEIQSFLRRFGLAGVDHSRQKDVVPPD